MCLYSKENFSGKRRCYEKDTKHNVPWAVGSIEMGRGTFRFLMYTQKDFKVYLGNIKSSVAKLDEKFKGFQSFYLVKPALNGRPNGISTGNKNRKN